MPKTRKEKQNKKEETEKDLEKEWKKLREKIKINLKKEPMKEIVKISKQELKEEKDESELEEEIEESEIPKEQFQEFQNFVPTIEIPRARAPVIERIERREIPQETLEENIASTPINREEQNNVMRYANNIDAERTGYSSLTQTREERRYEPEPVILRPVRETQEFSEFRRQEFLSPFEEERDWEDKIMDMSEIRTVEENRRLPFETEKKKYKEYKSEKLST